MLDDFTLLSRILTGESTLDPARAAEYLTRAQSAPEGIALHDLLERFREIINAGGDLEQGVRDRIMTDPKLAPLAQRILLLWYTSGWLNSDGKKWTYGTPDQYYSGLLWPAIRAHTPGLSGGYFGHWKYPPEN